MAFGLFESGSGALWVEQSTAMTHMLRHRCIIANNTHAIQIDVTLTNWVFT